MLCNILLQAIRAYFGALQQQHSEQQGQEPAADEAGTEEDGWDGSEAAPTGDDGPTLGQQHSSHWYGHEAAQSEHQSLPSGSGSPGREHDILAGFSEQRQGPEPGQGFEGEQGSAPCQQQDSSALSEEKQRRGSWLGLEQGSSPWLNSLREHYSDCLESLPGSPEGQVPTLQSPFADEGPQAGGQLSGPAWDGLPAPAEGLAGSSSAAVDNADNSLSAPEGVAEIVPGQHLVAHPDRPLHIPITQASTTTTCNNAIPTNWPHAIHQLHHKLHLDCGALRLMASTPCHIQAALSSLDWTLNARRLGAQALL